MIAYLYLLAIEARAAQTIDAEEGEPGEEYDDMGDYLDWLRAAEAFADDIAEGFGE